MLKTKNNCRAKHKNTGENARENCSKRSEGASVRMRTSRSPYPQVAGAGEVLSVLVERERHDAVRRVKRLLHAVAVVNVDVDVQHPLVVPEQIAAQAAR